MSELSAACLRGDADAVRRLLAAGEAGVNLRDAQGQTPLMVASATGNLEVAWRVCDGFEPSIGAKWAGDSSLRC
jgi:hypothetical protein